MRENNVRICEKYALTVTEAAAYFGIGEKKLRSMIEDYNHLGLFIQNGVKYMIKRKKFETFLDAMATI
jgi:excisionase family DNA binding protein